MSKVEANRRMIEAITLFLEGHEKQAEEVIRSLSETDISRLRLLGQDIAIKAENVFFEKRRRNRGEKPQ